MLNIGLSVLLSPQAPIYIAPELQKPTVWAWKRWNPTAVSRDMAFGRIGAVVVVVFEVVSSRMEFLAQYILLNH